jgi:hypothetical protein
MVFSGSIHLIRKALTACALDCCVKDVCKVRNLERLACCPCNKDLGSLNSQSL